MTQYDKLWNYQDVIETESRFREALSETSPEKDLSEHLQLLTQLARTQSLQWKFDEAHKILDGVEKQLTEEHNVEHIRYFLERGRAFNSFGDKVNAEICFRNSLDVAKKIKQDGYAIDAIHMLAIVKAQGEASKALNEEAIKLAEDSDQSRAKNWLGTLYNNLGWDYFTTGQYEKALGIFLRSLKWHEEKKSAYTIFIAKWCVAKTLRVLNRLDEALTIQLGLLDEANSTGHPDGYVHEELGELYLLKGDKMKSASHFEKAYALLSSDPYLARDERPRLDRMKELSK